MKILSSKKLSTENGLTLIEILASVLILTIIAITFLTIFVQSAKTNQISQKMLDATYLAQTEMEKIYQLQNENLNDVKNTLTRETSEDESEDEFNYTECVGGTCPKSECEPGANCYYKFDSDNNYYYQLTIANDEGNLYKVLVEVYKEDNKEAQLETRIIWINV